MSKTIEEAADEYADHAYYPAPDYGWYESDDEQMKECLSNAFKAGAERMREYIFQIYNDCGGDMDFVKWKLDREKNE